MKKNTLIRGICAMLVAVFCIGCFAACNKTEGGNEGTSAVTVPANGWNMGGGKATFKVIHPNNPTDTVETATNTLLDAIEAKTGVRPEKGNDYKKKGQEYNDSTYEIFVGRTKHDQTQSILSELEDGQFAIRVVGKKIIITAPKDADLVTAVDYFISTFVENMSGADGAYSLSVTDYTSVYVSTDKKITINGTDISEYTIVYETEREGYMDVAIDLKNKMETLGYIVNAVRDDAVAETDGAKEILIGKTNRQVSKTIYEREDPKLMTYKLVVDANYLQIVCGGPFSAAECIGTMMFRFFDADNTAYVDGEYLATDENIAEIAFAEGTDLRVMTANILAERWASQAQGTVPPIVQRAEIFAATLISSKPDVVGLQEADAEWIRVLPTYLEYIKETAGIEYRWIFNDYQGKQTLTSILYRSDKYEEIASGIENVSYWTNSDYNMRLFEWVYLREKGNANNKFIMSNTHWGWEDDEKIAECVALSVNKAKALKASYPGVPILHTGDFNSKHIEGEKYVDEYLFKTSCSDAMLVAKEKGVQKNNVGGCGTVGTLRAEGGSYIDHISYYGASTEILYYETLAAKNIFLSDHLPHIADFKLN